MQQSPRYNFRYPELTDQVSAFPPDVAAQNALLLDQVIGSLTDTTTEALAGKAAASHTHTMGQVTGLDTALAGKAAASHTHTMGQVDGLDTALAGKADATATQQALAGKAAASHTHTMGQVDGLDTALAGKADATATQQVLARVTALEAMGGLSPESPVDGQTANLVAQPGTLTRDEIVRATVAPSIMSVASSVVAKNLANGALPPMMPLLTGSPDEVIPNFSIQDPAENVPCPTRRDRTVWRIVARGTGESTIRADRVMSAETNIMPSSALSAWVYLPDPSKITRASIIVTGTDGTWNRSTTDYGTQKFHKGWNLVRFPTHTSAHQYLDKITQISIRVFYAGNGTDVEVLFGPLVAEKRPKASLVVINDWGSKEFYDNAYPLLKAAGIPVTWALRVNKLGDNSNPPNGHITLEQAQALMWENNNVVSFHSWQGNATSGLTAQEARDETIKAQAGLLARGLWSEGAVHRPAWVQNQAPNAYGADDYLATSGTPGDQYAPSPWPPVDRRKIPRFGLGAPLAQNLDLMKKTHYLGLTYTHGVLAPPYTHEQALPNHIGLAVFEDSLALITAGMAEGWLECTTMPDLVARERMEIPQEPPL